ncbi:Metallo-dependent phosphatase-like protein [Rhodocollybia butyracea]|uniref:Metallo-dependent phosphatase-like protein n=1 Tax=Rhodocollybia butyracea TaxID=206335 RepID=A0A9P5UAE6_9AGAR|nr:Metallo-dependent phosphatase-like protein [Rhodocollybia butyracea]
MPQRLQTLRGESARVYFAYDNPAEIPAKESGWTRFVCLSDTHSNTHWDKDGRMPRGDVLLHAGDLSRWGHVRMLKKTIDWLGNLEGYGSKIIIAGNHDVSYFSTDSSELMNLITIKLWLDKANEEELARVDDEQRAIALKECEEMMDKARLKERGLTYLEFEETKIGVSGIKEWAVYGSPASPRYSEGSFQYSTKEEAQEINSKIPHLTEILLTHTPPYGTLDKTRKDKHAGCKNLAKLLLSGDLSRCRLHVFGHIHEAAGVMIIPATERTPERVAVNAALPRKGQPIVVDLAAWEIDKQQ